MFIQEPHRGKKSQLVKSDQRVSSGTAMRGSVPAIFKEQQEPTPIAKRDSPFLKVRE
jgi:hypothetical protein